MGTTEGKKCEKKGCQSGAGGGKQAKPRDGAKKKFQVHQYKYFFGRDFVDLAEKLGGPRRCVLAQFVIFKWRRVQLDLRLLVWVVEMIDRKMNQMGFVNNGLGHIGGQPHPATKSSCDRRRSVVGCEDSSKSQPDLGERLFQFVFGKTESTPLGLKRFDRDRFPEQYPAPLDEFADPVETDTEEMAVFRSLLARTQLEHRELRLVYDAEKDGWSATAFHEKVNRQGASVVLMKTVGGAICGGYNPKVITARFYKPLLLLTPPAKENRIKVTSQNLA